MHLDEKRHEIKKTADFLNVRIKDMDNTLKVTEAYINAKLVLHDDELDTIQA